MNYKLIYDSTTIIRLTDNAFIPADPANTDYQAYLTWLGEGNTPEPYVPPAPTWEEIRSKRDGLLKDSDWSVASDANPKPSKQSWLDYRQSLRDIPQTFSSPESVVFPNKPE